MNQFKKLSKVFLVLVPMLLFAFPVSAAAPDGSGPWADTVFSSSQGLMKNGSAVPAIRSNPTTALGVAEFTLNEGDFFSLGFGGNIALGFDNGISNGAIIIETTNPGYPGELAVVDMSEDGVTWVTAGNVTQDGTVSQPEGVTCARYVRITDTSNPNDFSDATADGYDVDGVQATGDPCPNAPTPTMPAPTDTPPGNNSGNIGGGGNQGGGDGRSDGRSDGMSDGRGGQTSTGTSTAIVPGFPNAGDSGCVRSGNPLIPCLPNTGVGPVATTIPWEVPASAALGLVFFYLARKSYTFSSKR